MSVNHTPGPWQRLYSPDHHQPAIVTWDEKLDRPSGIIAFINRSEYNPNDEYLGPTDAANACLIAAAPELLEVCKDLAEFVGVLRYSHDPIYKRAKAIIAKAEGKGEA